MKEIHLFMKIKVEIQQEREILNSMKKKIVLDVVKENTFNRKRVSVYFKRNRTIFYLQQSVSIAENEYVIYNILCTMYSGLYNDTHEAVNNNVFFDEV